MEAAAKGKSKSDSSASKNKAEKKDPSSEKEPDYVYATTTTQPDRTLFIVDLSRLKAEKDTLENALVLYRPEADFKKPQYEQRCSQLVGLALCTMNFTSKYPEFIRLRGTCYAIRALGETYMMGLSSRIDEPPTCTVHYLKTLHDMFGFYYKSTDSVLRKCMEDWEIFTNTMASIFNKLLCYLIRDQHSVPSMLSPIPYANVNHNKTQLPSEKRNRSRLYMLASRVLKACQGHQTVLGGCILHNATILTSQFPPALTEKIAVVGGGAIPLDQCSVLEDNIAPGKVWVIEVYLYDEDVDKARSSRKNHPKISNVYSSLHLSANPNTMHLPLNLSLTPPTAPKRTHGNWRNKKKFKSPPPLPNRSTSLGLRSDSATEGPPPPPTRDPPTYKPSTSSFISSSMPQNQQQASIYHRDSVTSEDAVQLSPGLTRVQYSHPPAKKSTAKDPGGIAGGNKKIFNPSGGKDDDDYEDIDNLDEIDPSMALPARVLSKQYQLPSTPNSTPSNLDDDATPSSVKSSNESPLSHHRPSTDSISSEGFTTPPPVPPPRTSQNAELPSIYDDGGSTTADADYDTLESIHGNGTDGIGRPPLGRTVSEMTDDEIEKLVNTPISLPQNDQPKVSMLSSVRMSKVPALPSEMRTWKFKDTVEPDSDDDNDFVDSTELQEMLLANQLDKKQPSSSSSTVAAEQREKKHDNEMSPITPSPPPLPPREYTLSIMRKSGAGTTEDSIKLPVATVVGQLSRQTVIPPLPVRHVTGVKSGMLYSEHDVNGDDVIDGTLPRSEGQRTASWLYSDDIESPLQTTTDEATSTSLNRGDNPATNGSDGNAIVSTDQVKIQLPSVEQDAQRTESEVSLVNGNPTSFANKFKLERNGTGLADVERKESSSVDVERQIRNGTATTTLSLPQATKERSSFSSSVFSDDVFNELMATSESAERSRGERRGERLITDDLDLDMQSLDNEECAKERLDSLATDVDLSMVTVSESLARDGTVTPVQMTLNESMVNMLRFRTSSTPIDGGGSGGRGLVEAAAGEEENELLESAEYSSLPDDLDEEEEEMDVGSKTSTRTDMTDLNYEALGRPRTKSWLAKTMELRKKPASKVNMEKKCLYIQEYMSTMVVLLADSGLHNEHQTLNQLWRSLLPQLLDLDAGLKGEETSPSTPKPPNYVVTFSQFDRYCEANPRTASFQYRHALRRLHQEYDKDPTLLQASLCKDSYVRLLSQRVHNREVYFQPGKLGGTYDSLNMSGALERIAKAKTSLRQQPPGGPKVMII